MEDRPMVTMMTEMMGSPMRGRRMRRSTSVARMMEKTRVSRKDTRKGSWNCTVRAKQM